jgi:hypothetical protein
LREIRRRALLNAGVEVEVDTADRPTWDPHEAWGQPLPNPELRRPDAVPTRPQPHDVLAITVRCHLGPHDPVAPELEDETPRGLLAGLAYPANGFRGPAHHHAPQARRLPRRSRSGKRKHQHQRGKHHHCHAHGLNLSRNGAAAR